MVQSRSLFSGSCRESGLSRSNPEIPCCDDCRRSGLPPPLHLELKYTVDNESIAWCLAHRLAPRWIDGDDPAYITINTREFVNRLETKQNSSKNRTWHLTCMGTPESFWIDLCEDLNTIIPILLYYMAVFHFPTDIQSHFYEGSNGSCFALNAVLRILRLGHLRELGG